MFGSDLIHLLFWVAPVDGAPAGEGPEGPAPGFWTKAQPPAFNNRSLFWVAFITGAPAGLEGVLHPLTPSRNTN